MLRRLGILASCASLVAAAPAAWAGARAIKGPYLTNLADGNVDVRFELDAPETASVEVTREGAGAGRPGVIRGRDLLPERSTMHVVHVGGLEPSAAYAYTVRVGGAPIADGHFVSAPPAASAQDQTFLVYGDDRSNPAAHAAVVQAMQAVPADFLVNTGDVVADGGSAADWQAFFDVERALLRERPLFIAIGNHELYDDRAGANFARYFGFRGGAGDAAQLYGTARVGRIRLFVLNAMEDFAGGDERRWLEDELARADAEPGIDWRVAVLHFGPWSSGPHGPNRGLRDAKVPELLAAHKVDLVLAGHDHTYERGDGGLLKYIVSGGGGAPLYPISTLARTARKVESAYHFVQITTTADTVRVEARRVDGSVFDRCAFRKGGLWDCDDAVAPPARVQRGDALPAPHPPSSGGSERCACRVVGGGAGGDGGSRRAFIVPVLAGVAWAARVSRRPSRRPPR
ncbi:MAG TPA: metallophosphoesterase [Polyangiaceae bacterium]|nr:metallophosphoesterase [Polyangiaceae bacterium]